jgi:hypothetical protein
MMQSANVGLYLFISDQAIKNNFSMVENLGAGFYAHCSMQRTSAAKNPSLQHL